ncbi:uncharacterized protein LOC136033984 isoform X2 [Artemia franciscana]
MNEVIPVSAKQLYNAIFCVLSSEPDEVLQNKPYRSSQDDKNVGLSVNRTEEWVNSMGQTSKKQDSLLSDSESNSKSKTEGQVTSCFDIGEFNVLWRHSGPYSAIHYAKEFITDTTYIGSKIVNAILYGILRESHDGSTVSSVQALLNQLIFYHPPDNLARRDYYMNAFRFGASEDQTTKDLLFTLIDGSMGTTGMFGSLLSESESRRKLTPKKKKRKGSPIHSNTASSLEIMTEGNRDQEIDQIESYKVLLDFIVEFLCSDFSLWAHKRLKPYEDLRSNKTSPLIARIFWPNTPAGPTNALCSDLFNAFLKSLEDNDRFAITQISKLVSLIGEVSLLSSMKSKYLIGFPEGNAETFANRLENALREILETETDIITCLSNIKSPWLVMEVADRCLLRTMSGWKRHLDLEEAFQLKKTLDSTLEQSEVPTELSLTKVEKAPINSQLNRYGETKLHIACKNDYIPQIRSLIAAKVDVNQVDNAGWSPLHEAVAAGSVEAVSLLLSKCFQDPPPGISKIDITCPGHDFDTPLHLAVKTKNLETIQLLIKYGGNKIKNKKNKHGKTPRDMADPEFRAILNKLFCADPDAEVEITVPRMPRSVAAYLDCYLEAYAKYFKFGQVIEQLSDGVDIGTGRLSVLEWRICKFRYVRDLKTAGIHLHF